MVNPHQVHFRLVTVSWWLRTGGFVAGSLEKWIELAVRRAQWVSGRYSCSVDFPKLRRVGSGFGWNTLRWAFFLLGPNTHPNKSILNDLGSNAIDRNGRNPLVVLVFPQWRVTRCLLEFARRNQTSTFSRAIYRQSLKGNPYASICHAECNSMWQKCDQGRCTESSQKPFFGFQL